MNDRGQTLFEEALTLDLEEQRRIAVGLLLNVEEREDIELATSRLEQLQQGGGQLVPFEEALASLQPR